MNIILAQNIAWEMSEQISNQYRLNIEINIDVDMDETFVIETQRTIFEFLSI